MGALAPCRLPSCRAVVLIACVACASARWQMPAALTRSASALPRMLQQALQDTGYSEDPYEVGVDAAEEAEFIEDESLFYESGRQAPAAAQTLPQGPPLPGAYVPLSSLPIVDTDDKAPSAATEAAAAALEAARAQAHAPGAAPAAAPPQQGALARSTPRETQAVQSALNSTAGTLLGAASSVVGKAADVAAAAVGLAAAEAPAPAAALSTLQNQAAAAATTTGRGPDTLQGLYPGPDKEGPQHKPGTRHHHNLAGARADALPKPAQVQAAGVGAAAVATQTQQRQESYGIKPSPSFADSFTDEATSQPRTATLPVQQQAVAQGSDPLSQGPPSLGLGSTQTQGLDTDSDLGLTHNQAAQKASEEHLRHNGGRLFPEDDARVRSVDEEMLLGGYMEGPPMGQEASGTSRSRMRELAGALGAAMQSANGTSFLNIVIVLAAGGALVGVSVYYMRFMRPSLPSPRIVDVGSMTGPRYSRVPGRGGSPGWEEEKGWGDDNWDEPGTGRISKHSKGRDKWDSSF